MGCHHGALQHQPMIFVVNLQQEDTENFNREYHDQNLFSLEVLDDSGKDGEGRTLSHKWGSQEETLACRERGANSLV